MKLSTIIIGLFGTLAALSLGVYFWKDIDSMRYIFMPAVVLIAGVLTIRKVIDTWWIKQRGITVDDKLIETVWAHFPLRDYVPQDKVKDFFVRVNLFVEDKEIVTKGMSSIPHQLKAIMGAYASFFYMQDEKVGIPFPSFPAWAFYPHPFPTEDIVDFHICESHFEDGVALFSVPHLLKGNDHPDQYFNIALYECARIFLKNKYHKHWHFDLNQLCEIGGFTAERLSKYLGLTTDKIDLEAVAIVQYFSHQDAFKLRQNEWYQTVDQFLHQEVL